MFASLVSRHRCELYTIVVTDLITYEHRSLNIAPSNMPTMVRRASNFQRWFDPHHKRFDFRVGRCS